MPRDGVADVVIGTLALSEAQLCERVLELEADVAAYRLLAQQAIHALHRVTIERDILRGQIRINRHRDREPIPRKAAA